jgi:hypothetical protein
MNINSFENHVSTVIIRRGEDYYFNDAVIDLQGMKNGQWFALVEGSYDYEVDIRLETDGEISQYKCNCPYEGDVCKHVVAVLLKIRDEISISENDLQINEKKEAWKDIADNIPESELRGFIKNYAAKNMDFRKDLSIHFSQFGNYDNSGIYKQTVESIFYTAGGRTGFIDYSHAYAAMRPINDLLYKAEILTEASNFKEAFSIISAIAPECIDNIDFIDDSSGECGGAINQSFEIFSKIMELSDDQTFKNEVFDWLLLQAENKKYDDYGCADVLEPVFFHAAQTPEQIKNAFDFIESRLKLCQDEDDWSSNYRRQKYLKYKVDLYLKSDEPEKADKIIYDNIRLEDFRKIIVDRNLKNKNFTESIKLINEGIQIAENDELTGVVTNWKKQLLQIYQEMKDIKNVRKFACELFLSGWNEISYYRILKGTWKKEDAESEREKIIEKLSKKNRGFRNSYFPDSVAQLFIEEKMWSRLFEAVKNNPMIHALLTYSQYLKDDFSEELIEMYIPAIEKYAENNTGRSAYKDIINYLYKMSELRGGKEKAVSLMKTLLNTYKNRPAMKDEFMSSSFFNV